MSVQNAKNILDAICCGTAFGAVFTSGPAAAATTLIGTAFSTIPMTAATVSILWIGTRFAEWLVIGVLYLYRTGKWPKWPKSDGGTNE